MFILQRIIISKGSHFKFLKDDFSVYRILKDDFSVYRIYRLVILWDKVFKGIMIFGMMVINNNDKNKIFGMKIVNAVL